jgi:class 3 adenylate cyclase
VDLGAWLRGLGLGRYEQAFRDNDVDAEVLPELTADDLVGLGVGSSGHRRKLLAAIATLRKGRPRGTPPTQAETAPSTTGHIPVPKSSEAERRHLTVMFVDLVGSTALSTRLDPEEMHEVIRAYQDAVAGAVARYEGHIGTFMGDGVLAYFGFPQAHEDNAERAVRAGLDIPGTVGRLRSPEGGPLAARVGIATGLVVVGDLVGSGPAQEQAVVGETPNLAARLQALAEPGTVVIAQATRQLVGGLFECADLGGHRVRGFVEPIRAWRVLGPSRAADRFEAMHGGSLAPMVGRDQEIALLLDRWRRAKEGEGQIVLLAGEAGIGKSRLVMALRERLQDEPYIRLSHSCSPYHVNSALWPVTERLMRAAGFARNDTPALRLAKLEWLLEQAGEPAEGATAALAELLGLPPGGHHALPDLTPQQKKGQVFAALLAQLDGLAHQGPVLLTLEDLHWLDPTSRELFDRVVDRTPDLPVLFVATFRPELPPPWSALPHVTLLSLNRLARAEAAGLIERQAGGRPLPPAVSEAILSRTEGVPLFVEELTKAVLESGLLQVTPDGTLELARSLSTLAIPRRCRTPLWPASTGWRPSRRSRRSPRASGASSITPCSPPSPRSPNRASSTLSTSSSEWGWSSTAAHRRMRPTASNTRSSATPPMSAC